MRDVLDLGRYPLDLPESRAYRVLVEDCRRDLAAAGMFNLHGFLLPDVAASEAARLTPRFNAEAFHHERDHNIYFDDAIPGLPMGHPALQRLRTSNLTLCADQIGRKSPLLRLYEWPQFSAFLGAVLKRPALHVMDDPLARVNVMSYGPKQALNWHFDRSEFTTTLLIQPPVAGGQFEYRPSLRSAQNPNYEGVADLMLGRDCQTQTLTLEAGTLNVFMGQNTAHRVTPIEGNTPRIVAVFSFFDRPGVTFSEDERRGFYGRA